MEYSSDVKIGRFWTFHIGTVGLSMEHVPKLKTLRLLECHTETIRVVISDAPQIGEGGYQSALKAVTDDQ